MDDANTGVATFLQGLSAIVWGEDLYRGENGLWTKLVRRGAKPTRPGSTISVLSGHRPALAIEIIVGGDQEKQLTFGIQLVLNEGEWSIEPYVFLENWPEGDGERSLRDLPSRRAGTINELLARLREAAIDLSQCDDALDELIPSQASTPPSPSVGRGGADRSRRG